MSGTRLDRDRPARQTMWPGEDAEPAVGEAPIINRDKEFVEFVIADVERRAEAETQFPRGGDIDSRERP